MNYRNAGTRASSVAKVAGAFSILLALMAWALASPVGASPDEDYHLTSIWCGHGLRAGVCESGTDSANRRISVSLLQAPCFAFRADISASCQGSGFAGPEGELLLTDRGNFTGGYPPVFYFFNSFFVGHDISDSVVLMRFVEAALFVLVIAATYLASAPGLRRPIILGTAVTMVPLGMFIVPSINPSSWAMLSAATLAVSVLGYVTADDRRRRLVLGGLAALSLLIGAGARGDAAMYSVVAIVAALILSLGRGARRLRRSIYPLILAVIAVFVYRSTGQSGAAGGGSIDSFDIKRFARFLIDIPDLWIGALGMRGLGWLDTTMPALVWVAAFAMFAGTLYAALSGSSPRRCLAVGVVGLALWFMPTYVQYLWNIPVGQGVQPRYILPLMTLLAIIAFARIDGMAFRLSAAQRWIVVAGLSVANAIALHTNMRRYVTGSDVTAFNLDFNREWWWGMPVGPMAVWGVGAFAFAAGLILLTRELTLTSPAERESVGVGADADQTPAGPQQDLPLIH